MHNLIWKMGTIWFGDYIFSNETIWELAPNKEWWTSEHLDWSIPENQNINRKLIDCTGRRWLQWKWIHTWETIWGCIDVFPFMVWTTLWPSLEEWKWKVLVLEPSEEQMPTYAFERIIRNLWSQWILQVLEGDSARSLRSRRNGAHRRARDGEKEGRRKKKFRSPKTYLRRPSFSPFDTVRDAPFRETRQRWAESPTSPLLPRSPRTIPPATTGAGGASFFPLSSPFAAHHFAHP